MSDDGKAFWERTAGRYDLSMTLFGGPLEAMLPLVTEEVDGLERVLELASGTGLVSAAEAMVAKLDDRVRELGFDNVSSRTLDVYTLDGEEQFDAIVAANVLHLLPDLDGALNAMCGALKPGGRLIVPTYCHDQTALARVTSSVMGLVGFPGQRRLTLDRLSATLTDRGLRIRRSELLGGLLPIGFVSVEAPVLTHDKNAI